MIEIGQAPPTRSRVVDDYQALADEYAESDLTYRELGERYGVTRQAIEQLIRRTDPTAIARRRERRARRNLDREWQRTWTAMQRALDTNKVCPACGAWVIRSGQRTCSPECNRRVERTCNHCGYEGPSRHFQVGDGRPRNVCKPCSSAIAAAWYADAHFPEPTVTEWTCAACQRTLPASAYWRKTKGKTGLQTYCKECERLLVEGLSVAEIAERHGVSYRRTSQTVPS